MGGRSAATDRHPGAGILCAQRLAPRPGPHPAPAGKRGVAGPARRPGPPGRAPLCPGRQPGGPAGPAEVGAGLVRMRSAGVQCRGLVSWDHSTTITVEHFSKGASVLKMHRMVAEGSPPSDLVQRLVLASAADLPAPQLLRWLAIAFLGASPDPEAGTPSTLDMLAALLAGVSDAGARGMDPGRHAALALTLDRGAGRPAQALQHYERAFLLTQGGGVSSGAASGRGSAGSPGSAQLAPALAVLHALAAHRAGDARRAQRAVDAALHAAPAAPGLWLALAAGLAREGRGIVAARCALRAAVAGGPRATRPWDALALLLAAAGRPDLADISVHSRQHLAATGGGFQGLEAELLGELRRMQEGS
uniref:Uncharacterized protein n=1 Tax=Auxenochlorella protothecoides TaxID=3075 RepID=A0A1D2ABG0_AUXPR